VFHSKRKGRDVVAFSERLT